MSAAFLSPRSCCFSHDYFLALDLIPKVAARLPNSLVGLDVALLIGGAHGQNVCSGFFRRPRVLPGAKRVGTEVFAERRFVPASPRGIGEFYFDHAAKAAQGSAANGDRQTRGNF